MLNLNPDLVRRLREICDSSPTAEQVFNDLLIRGRNKQAISVRNARERLSALKESYDPVAFMGTFRELEKAGFGHLSFHSGSTTFFSNYSVRDMAIAALQGKTPKPEKLQPQKAVISPTNKVVKKPQIIKMIVRPDSHELEFSISEFIDMKSLSELIQGVQHAFVKKN